MKKPLHSLLHVIFLLPCFLASHVQAVVNFDSSIPQEAFAAQEIEAALQETNRGDLQITLSVKLDPASPEAYVIQAINDTHIEVTGSDAKGAMYGGLEVAELLRMGLPIKNAERTPFIEKRGIKFNIPWDARTPSYDDTGDSAQMNVETVWDFEFWKAYLDDLARNRYNVLSLWSTFPYAHLVKFDEYPDAVLNDVYRLKDGLAQPKHRRDLFKEFDTNGDGAISLEDGVLELVKEITIDEKIAHWQKVFKYAEDRGIEIYLFSWNVFTHGATGKHGITQDQTNPKTIEYVRKCVQQVLENFPQVAGIGVCSGENDRRELDGTPESCEHYIYQTYGQAIMDVQKERPDREVRFIYRRHSSELDWVLDAFKDYTGGILDVSVKYAVAHLYSSRRPQEWESRIVEEGWNQHFKTFLNLRNDDIFMHRWGSPDFVREFIKWMPREESPGFFMGSDGYVWARNFTSARPELEGQLEVEKHWYRFRLWGQLAYDNNLGDDYWEAVLQHRFDGVDASLLHDTWESVSEIIPQLNRAVWSGIDAAFAPEGSMELFAKNNYLSIESYYFGREPMKLSKIENGPDPQCISATEWAEAVVKGNGRKLKGLTPLQVADNLDDYAQAADAALPRLRRQAAGSMELNDTLLDIESMAHLGHYYADKMRAAAQLALYRANQRQDREVHTRAVRHLEDSLVHWRAYAKVLDLHYIPQLMARTGYMDWNKSLGYMQEELETIRKEADVPQVSFARLQDGDTFTIGSDLRIQVNASHTTGIAAVKLYLNGLLLNAEKKADAHVWSSASDEELRNIAEKFYRIEAVAIDVNGFASRQVATIKVGQPKIKEMNDWMNEIHHVFMNEGDILQTDKKNEITFELDRLESTISLSSNGTMTLVDEAAEQLLWRANSKTPDGRHHAQFKDGQLKTFTGWPGEKNHKVWESKKPSNTATGPFKLGITRGKRIVCFTGENDEIEIAWFYLPIPR